MRAVQFRLLTKLLNKFEVPSYIYAFERYKSIPAMAVLHVNKCVVISLDLKDFFPSIKQNMLHRMMMNFGLGEKAARTVSEICTYKAFVPQGALTSPKVANLVTAHTFGPEVKAFCDEKELTLSIYADDITVSSNNPELNITEIITGLTAIVRNHGFRVNRDKTKVMWRTSRQYVCGVVVNEKTNLIRKEREKLRAIVHNIVQNGIQAEAQKSGTEPGQFLMHVQGRLNWFRQLNPVIGGRYMGQLKAYVDSNPLATSLAEGVPVTSQQISSQIEIPESLMDAF